ncbi:MAG: pyrimidine reductase family protein [Acidimicrobiales bacterium]
MNEIVRRLYPEPAQDVELDAAYAWPDPSPGRGVHVRVNFVSSLDGAVDLHGSARPLSSPVDNLVFSTLRGLCDVILVGAGTVRRASYGPARPSANRRSWRCEHGLAPVPPFAVVSSSMALDLSASFFAEAVSRPLVLTTEAAPMELRSAAAGLAEVIVAGDTRVEAHRALTALAGRGLTHVLCEGGPTLAGLLAGADAVDELCLSLSALLVGPADSRLLAPAPGVGSWPVPLELEQVLSAESMLFLRYSRLRAGQGPPVALGRLTSEP